MDRLEQEREHHDGWAGEIDVEALDVRASFEGSTSPENRFIMRELGDLTGKRVLDIGCGAGESTVYMALQGAICTGTDLSEGMVEVARRLAALNGVQVDFRVMDGMRPEFPDESFDSIYAANFLHHVDPVAALKAMKRLVKPGGKVCFWDPLRHNPVINVYRRMATKVRSQHEEALGMDILKHAQQEFTEVRYETFWLTTLWIFLRFYLIEGVHPNSERYWKKIITEEARLRPKYQRLERLDNLIKRWLPFLRRYAWNIAVVATK